MVLKLRLVENVPSDTYEVRFIWYDGEGPYVHADDVANWLRIMGVMPHTENDWREAVASARGER